MVGSAAAQPFGSGWGPGQMMGPGMMGQGMMGGLCSPRAAGLAEWRVEAIERAVRPTDAQRPALDALKSASAKAAEMIVSACPREVPASPSDRLASMEKRLGTMLEAIKIVRPAFDNFYASLSDEQKQKLSSAGPRRWGWRNWR
ncbi:Spy/CpxP family protein refolding chaperone [Roseiarcaceae bacterium H3SJ34-1]|uniref:Spy/CpxP family protein refolding chaperone n=1 Tax=Terripilifer ovatus TaxID=3032367 RepID=UPI003AB94B12|nr:Spy/CpxP family protein refolding chaperone [Roseiarcaceae bacterium H3SJ34-1]